MSNQTAGIPRKKQVSEAGWHSKPPSTLRLRSVWAFAGSAIVFGACALAIPAQARDLGVLGATWPVTEVDVRQLLVEDAARTDWAPAQTKLKDGAKRYLADLPKRQMETSPTTQTLWVDPSVVLGSDIQAPVQGADGTYQWQVLATKGTRINPLIQFRPVTAFLLFDGSDERQLELVRKVLAVETTRLIPVEAGSGDITQNNKALKRSVYHANDAMMSRFQVRYLPSLVYPGSGPHELFLGVTSFALPFEPGAVLATWPTLGYSPKQLTEGATP